MAFFAVYSCQIPPGQPISRILSRAIICLGRVSRPASMRSTRGSGDTSSISPLLDLAPGGGCLAADVATRAGGLLHRLFTITACLAPSKEGGAGGYLFLWPCTRDCSPPGVARHRALWSADFPRLTGISRDRLADLGQLDITTKPVFGLDKITTLV